MQHYCLMPLCTLKAIAQAVLPASIARGGLAGWLPDSLSNYTFLGLYLWQYGGILLVLLLSVIAYGVLHWFFSRLVHHHFVKRWTYPNNLSAAGPLSIALVACFVIATVPLLQLPMVAERFLVLLSRGLVAFLIAYLSYQLVDLLSFYIQQQSNQKNNQVIVHLLPLLRKSAKVVVVSLGTLWVMQQLNFDTKALLAGFSIGGIAFALASQDTLKNLFGSLMILIDKPFSIGDVIVSGAIEGKVEEIGLRSTRLRTTQDSVIYVPNAKLADIPIDNYGSRRYRRFLASFIIAYDTPPALIEAFIEGLRQVVHQHPYVMKDRCLIYLSDLKEAKLEIKAHIYFRTADYRKEMQGRHEILARVLKLAASLGITFAGPLRASYPEYTADPEALKQRLHEFFAKGQKAGKE